jgi:phosphate transport system substrate-binding protein
MNKRFSVLIALMVAGVMVFSACAPAAPAAPAATTAPAASTVAPAAPTVAPTPELSGKLQIAGSTSVQPLAEKWAAEFMKAYPKVTVEVQGGGSSVGVTSAGQGTVAIGSSSRMVKDSELATFPNLKSYIVAWDGIAVIVNNDVKLTDVRLAQLPDIFGGKIKNFKGIGGNDASIQIVSREEGSGTRAAFEELALSPKDASGKAVLVPITDKALLQQSNGQMKTVVSTTPNTMGYLSFGFIDNSVKALSLDGIKPTVENVKNKTYPISRPFVLLTNGDAKDLAKVFIDWVMSDAGQAIAVKDGYMSYK